MTTGDLALILTAFLACLVFVGFLADRLEPNPFEGERRRDWQ